MEQLVNFETAKLAKEAGFDWGCYHTISEPYLDDVHLAFDLTGENKFTKEDIQNAKENGYNAYLLPEQSLLQKWLRDEYGIYVDVYVEVYSIKTTFFTAEVTIQNLKREFGLERISIIIGHKTYESSLEAGLQSALKLVISKNSQGGN